MAKETASYAEETIEFTTAAYGKQPAVEGTLDVTYDTTRTAKEKRQGYYEVTAVSGTYEVLAADGSVETTDAVTKLVDKGHIGGNNDRLYVDSDDVATIVDRHGLSFEISDPTTDRPHRTERLNLFVSKEKGKGYELYSNYHDRKVTTLTTSSSGSASTKTSTEAVVCFVSGTRLAMDHGSVAVEALNVGDVVVTLSGELRPIRWLGHRTIDCRHSRDPAAVAPVRIVAHAFGEDRPARDLRVSPGHAICVDVMGEILIPAGALVNGMTIITEPVERVTYWHVELDSHDIVLAENLPAESYLDMGNRAFFSEADAVALHASADIAVAAHTDFCRPFITDGPLHALVRGRVARQASCLAAARAASRDS